MKKILITGGCGFLGTNISLEAIKLGHNISIIDNFHRIGSRKNLELLNNLKDIKLFEKDIREKDAVNEAILKTKPDWIFHLAGQVAMTTSLENPRFDFEVNTIGTLNILEAIRINCPDTSLIYSSTNKVYGDLSNIAFTENNSRYVANEYPNGFDENLPLDFHSPYGCSKGSAEQYVLDYVRAYGLKATVFRHSSMYGGNQYPTIDQGWITWFTQRALAQHKGIEVNAFSISGNGKQVRDALHADDITALYYSAANNIDNVSGEAFNIGGGMEHSLSLLELFKLLEEILGTEVQYYQKEVRYSDQKVFVADLNKITSAVKWAPRVSPEIGLRKLLDWLESTL